MTAGAVAAPEMTALEARARPDPTLSLYQLLDPEVLADPYPLYRRLRERDPVFWDPFLCAWVVTDYANVLAVLHRFSAERTPTPAQLNALGLGALEPIARVMVKQMLFMDAPAHTRLRGLCSRAFTPRRVEQLREHIQDIVDRLLDRVMPAGRLEVLADFAAPLPAIVTAELLGVPAADHQRLKAWSADYAEMLGNFQHNPDRAGRVLRSVEEMTAYFRAAIREQASRPRDGLLGSLLTAEVDGSRLSEDEVIANVIVTMVGGQETTTNLIGNGLLTLLRHPDQLARLRDDPSIAESAIEELLRYESPSQHTARLAPDDRFWAASRFASAHPVMAVMAAANRDPARFPDPDRLDLTRTDNRHLAFGWAAHFCFGAPLARMEAQIAFTTLLRRLPDLALEPGPLVWREESRPARAQGAPCLLRKPPRRGAQNTLSAAVELSEAKRRLLERMLQGDVVSSDRQPETAHLAREPPRNGSPAHFIRQLKNVEHSHFSESAPPAQLSPPKVRQARFEDYQQIYQLEFIYFRTACPRVTDVASSWIIRFGRGLGANGRSVGYLRIQPER